MVEYGPTSTSSVDSLAEAPARVGLLPMQETRGSDRCNRPASDLPEACRWRLAKSPNRGVITQRRTRLADAPELTPLTTRQDNAQSEEKEKVRRIGSERVCYACRLLISRILGFNNLSTDCDGCGDVTAATATASPPTDPAGLCSKLA
jgi:hypothetical protein